MVLESGPVVRTTDGDGMFWDTRKGVEMLRHNLSTSSLRCLRTRGDRRFCRKPGLRGLAGAFAVAAAVLAGTHAADAAHASYVGILYDLAAAKQAGNLCEEAPRVEATLNQLKIRWTGARLALGANQDGSVRGRCLLRIPAVVPQGYRIAMLTSRSQSRAAKPQGVGAQVNLATILTMLPPLESEREFTAEDATFGRTNTYRDFSGLEPLTTEWDRELCSLGRTSDLILGINLGAVLQRQWGDAAASLDFSGQDYGVDVWIELLPCSDHGL